ncbi:MAG: hypothetical protein Q9169_004945 [Polycauliona sp. 2 TL-2023]
MGIPRFAGHLQPYSINTTLGYKGACSTSDVADPPRLVIDGPGLAYHIYYRLAHRSNAQGAFDASPSYHRIGQAAVAFLCELEAHHIHLSHIYFDGYLPLHKRRVRLGRLESCLKDLIKLQAKCPKGLALAGLHPEASPTPLTHSQLFNSFHSVPHVLRGLPAPPFLVPAVLDALSTSTHASITEIVPAEADTACAKAAKDEGGVILTNDSDMLVYDIGDTSAVVFFSGLEIHEEPESTHVVSVLKANIYPTAQIAKRLELPGLQQLAYQCKLDATVSLAEARRKMHQPMQDESLWQRFQEEYSTQHFDKPFPAQSLGAQLRAFLDPRLSELIIQLFISAGDQEITSTSHASLMTLPELRRAVSSWFRYRIFALRELYCWYVVSLKNAPSRNSIVRTMMGFVDSPVQWEDMHLEAQIQAVLYALRMVKQGLGYFPIGKIGASDCIVELEARLRDLPPLGGLLPSCMEIRGLAVKENVEVSQAVSYIMQIEQSEI